MWGYPTGVLFHDPSSIFFHKRTFPPQVLHEVVPDHYSPYVGIHVIEKLTAFLTSCCGSHAPSHLLNLALSIASKFFLTNLRQVQNQPRFDQSWLMVLRLILLLHKQGRDTRDEVLAELSLETLKNVIRVLLSTGLLVSGSSGPTWCRVTWGNIENLVPGFRAELEAEAAAMEEHVNRRSGATTPSAPAGGGAAGGGGALVVSAGGDEEGTTVRRDGEVVARGGLEVGAERGAVDRDQPIGSGGNQKFSTEKMDGDAIMRTVEEELHRAAAAGDGEAAAAERLVPPAEEETPRVSPLPPVEQQMKSASSGKGRQEEQVGARAGEQEQSPGVPQPPTSSPAAAPPNEEVRHDQQSSSIVTDAQQDQQYFAPPQRLASENFSEQRPRRSSERVEFSAPEEPRWDHVVPPPRTSSTVGVAPTVRTISSDGDNSSGTINISREPSLQDGEQNLSASTSATAATLAPSNSVSSQPHYISMDEAPLPPRSVSNGPTPYEAVVPAVDVQGAVDEPVTGLPPPVHQQMAHSPQQEANGAPPPRAQEANGAPPPRHEQYHVPPPAYVEYRTPVAATVAPAYEQYEQPGPPYHQPRDEEGTQEYYHQPTPHYHQPAPPPPPPGGPVLVQQEQYHQPAPPPPPPGGPVLVQQEQYHQPAPPPPPPGSPKAVIPQYHQPAPPCGSPTDPVSGFTPVSGFRPAPPPGEGGL